MAIIDFPYIFVPDPAKGRPLFNGQLFFGIPDLDPEIPANQKQLNVVQEDGTVIPVSQPFIIGPGGVPTYNGATVRLDVDGNYSFKVLDKNGAQTYYVENVFEGEPITTLEAVAIVLNTDYDNVMSSTDLVTPIVGYIRAEDQEKTYSVPADAQGKFISSVDVDVLNTTVGGPYQLIQINAEYTINQASQFGVSAVVDSGDIVNELLSDKLTNIDIDTLYKATTTGDIDNLLIQQNAELLGMTNDTTAISARNKNSDLVGIQHNYNEEKLLTPGPTPAIVTGKLQPPPISDASNMNSVDIMGHWYNDFGLEYTRVQNGGGGWVGWYTWEWNHTDTALDGPYDPQRHPTLGWYRGDDATVLDWQCYWLREAGLAGVILQATALDTTTWSDPEDRDYWIHQLFKQTPNFKGLSYVVGGPSQGLQAAVEAAWAGILSDIYAVHGNYQVVEVNGRLYPAIYLHDVATLRTGTFASDAAFEAWVISLADYFKTAGFDGVYVYGRNATYYTTEANLAKYRARFAEHGVVMSEVDYGNFSGSYTSPTEYSDYVTQFGSSYAAVNYRHLPNIMTSRDSKNHPSAWDTPGSTPALFRDVLEKAVNAAVKNETISSIVTIYNIAEWGEAGPSLQPNVADGWGYLDALRGVRYDDLHNKHNILELSHDKNVAGSSTNLASDAGDINFYSTFSVTLNAAPFLPTVAAGYDGQIITLMNTANAGSFNIILVDEATTAGTKLFLSATSVTIGPWDSIVLRYSATKGGWVQIGNTNVL